MNYNNCTHIYAYECIAKREILSSILVFNLSNKIFIVIHVIREVNIYSIVNRQIAFRRTKR